MIDARVAGAGNSGNEKCREGGRRLSRLFVYKILSSISRGWLEKRRNISTWKFVNLHGREDSYHTTELGFYSIPEQLTRLRWVRLRFTASPFITRFSTIYQPAFLARFCLPFLLFPTNLPWRRYAQWMPLFLPYGIHVGKVIHGSAEVISHLPQYKENLLRRTP